MIHCCAVKEAIDPSISLVQENKRAACAETADEALSCSQLVLRKGGPGCHTNSMGFLLRGILVSSLCQLLVLSTSYSAFLTLSLPTCRKDGHNNVCIEGPTGGVHELSQMTLMLVSFLTTRQWVSSWVLGQTGQGLSPGSVTSQ